MNQRLLIVTTARNEGPFLLEWLAHHLGAGATDVPVYSNDCEDGTDAMLDLLAGAGVLSHVRPTAPPGESVQRQALRAAWRQPLGKAADWVPGIELDEFVKIHVAGHRFAARDRGRTRAAVSDRAVGQANAGRDQPLRGEIGRKLHGQARPRAADRGGQPQPARRPAAAHVLPARPWRGRDRMIGGFGRSASRAARGCIR